MKETIFEQRGGTYRQQGDYLLPDLAIPESATIGAWGRRRLRHLKEHRKGIYTGLQLSGKLDDHLADVDRQAADMFTQLIVRMAQAQGITEELKAKDQIAWVGAMNNIQQRVEEIVNAELIYT